MSTLGTGVAQSVAGISQAEHKAVRDAERARPQPRQSRAERLLRGEDEVELNQAQTDEAVRSLKDNADQETDLDRRKQDHYRPAGNALEHPPRLDVQG